ncbi:MAG: membrane protein insertion efficiency factor YidD [Candidatus Nanopelagicaceae bacterium]|nr:membrane protein insertion efficiency factor YidD [Candidatus Nanopelagicaceae bacterium]
MKQLFLLTIIGYQKFISPFFVPRCKYYPSCSSYTELAISEFGVKGFFMATWRLIRCNPFSHGGVDYPSQKAVLKIRQRQNT